MVMIVKEEHVTVTVMEACVTLGNFVKRNFNFVQMRFFMKAVPNVNQERDHGSYQSDSRAEIIELVVR